MSEDPKKTFGHRLRQARVMRGWSLRQLSEATHGSVSHNALAKYERAEMMPGSAILVALADVLGQPVDFFFRGLTLHLQDVRFRKKSRLGSKVAESIKELSIDFFERYYEIEQLTGDSRPFSGKLPSLVRTPEEAEEAADHLRKAWNLGSDPIPNLIELAEFHGIKVFEVPTEDGAFDGFSAETEAGPIIVLGAQLEKNIPRKRMTTTHEIGHLVISLPENIMEREEEPVMRRFAGALMLPKEPFAAAFGRRRRTISLQELMEIKGIFGVSMMGIVMRAKQLGLISESSAEAFFKHANTHGWRSRGEPGDDCFRGREQFSRFRQLVYRAAAEETITFSKGAALLGIPLGQFRGALREVFG